MCGVLFASLLVISKHFYNRVRSRSGLETHRSSFAILGHHSLRGHSQLNTESTHNLFRVNHLLSSSTPTCASWSRTLQSVPHCDVGSRVHITYREGPGGWATLETHSLGGPFTAYNKWRSVLEYPSLFGRKRAIY